MENLSIARLCSIPEENFNGSLSLHSFISDKKPSIKKEIEGVLQANQERHIHKLNLYKSILRKCVDQLKLENALKKTDMLFYIDDNLYENPYYERDECINFLIVSLRKHCLDVFLMPQKVYGQGPYSKSILFVSWKFTEHHKKSQFFTNPN